jgi:hypothetical protein
MTVLKMVGTAACFAGVMVSVGAAIVIIAAAMGFNMVPERYCIERPVIYTNLVYGTCFKQPEYQLTGFVVPKE